MGFSGKLWEVVDVLDNARQATPDKKVVKVNPAERLYPIMTRQELLNILTALEDKDLIRVISEPKVYTEKPHQPSGLHIIEDMFLLKVEVEPALRDYRNELYQSSWIPISTLRTKSLLKVFDVADDIKQETELKSKTKFSIPLVPSELRFPELFPKYTKKNEEAYIQGRLNACEFLEQVGGIKKFRWVTFEKKLPREGQLEITLDQEDFDNIYGKLVHYTPDDYQKLEPQPMPDDLPNIIEVPPDLIDQKTGKIRKDCLNDSRLFPDSGIASYSPSTVKLPTYDEINNEIVYNDQRCAIPDGTVQHFICLQALNSSGEPALVNDIIEEWGREETTRTIPDAVRSINKKADEAFGLSELLDYKNEKVRLSKHFRQ